MYASKLLILLLLPCLPISASFPDRPHASVPNNNYKIIGRYLGCFIYPFCQSTEQMNENIISNSSISGISNETCFETCYWSDATMTDESSTFMMRWGNCVCVNIKRHQLTGHMKVEESKCHDYGPNSVLEIEGEAQCISYGFFFSFRYQYCPEPEQIENEIAVKELPVIKALVHRCEFLPQDFQPRLQCGDVRVSHDGDVSALHERRVYREYHTLVQKNSPRNCLAACLKEGHLDMNDFALHNVIIALGENGDLRGDERNNCGCYFADEWADIHWETIPETEPDLCIWCPDLVQNCHDPEVIDKAFCGGYFYEMPSERYLISIYQYTGNISEANCSEYVPPLPNPVTSQGTTGSTSGETSMPPTTTTEMPSSSETPTTDPEGSIATPPGTTTEPITATVSSTLTEFESTPSPTQCTNESVRCSAKDKFGNNWSGCAGQIVRQPCHRNATGFASWECMLNGEFYGRWPDYSNCVSVWLDRVEAFLEAESVILPNVTDTILMIIQTKYEATKESNGTKPQFYGHEMKRIFEIGRKTLKLTTEETETSLFENLTYKAMWILGNVFTFMEPWQELDVRNSSETGTQFIKAMEESILELTTRILKNETFASQGKYQRAYDYHKEFNMGCGVQLKEKTEKEKICYPFTYSPDKDSYIDIPSNWAEYFADQEIEFAGMQIDSGFVNMMFPGNPTTASHLPGTNDESLPPEKLVNGNLLSFSFDLNGEAQGGGSGFNFSGTGVRITFQHAVEAWGSKAGEIRRNLHPGERAKAVLGSAQCVFWNPDNLEWSSEGCILVETTRTRTVCECFHLTSFALLMDLHRYSGKDPVLEVLTWILSSVSIICLSFCIFVFSSSIKSSQSPRSEITNHLCIWLLIGHFLVLLFMDRHFFYLGEGMCTTTAIALHYSFLVVFMWSAMEGLQLYKMVIVVFDNGKDYMMAQRIGAYGLPALIVAITGISGVITSERAYGGDAFCWLEGSFIWAFIIPVAIVTLVNLVILIMCMRKATILSHTKIIQVNKKDKTIRSWVKGALSISVLLGVTWLVGFIMLTPLSGLSNFAAYLFTIFNASQGILLFIFHVWMNENVRARLQRHFPKIFLSRTSSKAGLGKAWSANSTSSSIFY